MARDSARPAPRAAAAMDAAALAAFVVVGVVQHDGPNAAGIVRTGIPLLGAWFLVALVLGTYRRTGWPTCVLTWALGVPLGLLVRSIVRGGPWGRALLVFGEVALAFTLLFLIGGRVLLLVAGALRRRSRGSAEGDLRTEGGA